MVSKNINIYIFYFYSQIQPGLQICTGNMVVLGHFPKKSLSQLFGRIKFHRKVSRNNPIFIQFYATKNLG